MNTIKKNNNTQQPKSVKAVRKMKAGKMKSIKGGYLVIEDQVIL